MDILVRLKSGGRGVLAGVLRNWPHLSFEEADE